MKLPILAAAFLAGATLVQAQVPGLINYQGRLTTPSGAPATGTRNFSLSIFDSETGGTLLYNEAVGPVALDATGVYSFQFGSAGASNTQVVETLATTDGTASSFQKVLSNTGVVAGSLSVTDGTYTWSQSAGSSNEDDFGVAYSSSLRRVTVTYYSAPPAAGKPITATYRYATSGISGAISAGTQHWMALSIDGVAQTGRQRVLAVPFAMQAGYAAKAGEAERLMEKPKIWRPENYSGSLRQQNSPNSNTENATIYFPMSYPYKPNLENNSQYDSLYGKTRIPSTIEQLESVRLSAILGKRYGSASSLNVSIIKINPADRSEIGLIDISNSAQPSLDDTSYSPVSIEIERPIRIELDHRFLYEVRFYMQSFGPTGPLAAEIKDLSFSVVE
jgi:hypothetical protein